MSALLIKQNTFDMAFVRYSMRGNDDEEVKRTPRKYENLKRDSVEVKSLMANYF